MQSDVRTERHGQRESANFKGLATALQDARMVPDGYQRVAQNIVYDEAGNARPKDGSSQWWAPIAQRVYLAEMEPSEDATWTNGTPSTAQVAFGAQSRLLATAGTTTITRVPASSIDLLLLNGYTAAQASLTLSVYAATPADVTSCVLYVSSGAGFAAVTRSWDITANINAATAATWTAITKTFASGTDIGGAPDFTGITRMKLVVTCTAGANLYFDEWYVSFSDYTKSIPLGCIEFRHIQDNLRYTVAGFGDTLFADLNEARAPYKIVSGRTRNTPHYFDFAGDRLAIFNTVDDNLIFTGSTVRKLGHPKPSAWTPGFTYGAGGGLTPTAVYYYGITFVYGEGAVTHGQSTMFESPTAATLPGGNGTVNLANIPVGGVGAGVIARRIYRCVGNAGALASKFFVAQISDNTTTTYADTLADVDLVAGAEGPINNGVPPKAKMGVWYQKGMVYIDAKNIYYSRPGFDLDASFEIVPAENILTMGNMGEQVCLIEFNGNLYVLAKGGLGRLTWRGSVLEYFPVQRTSENRAQSVGCYDGRGVTVVDDRLLRWYDVQGQVWEMLPNEEIYPRSKSVSNLCDNFNGLPLATSLDYARYDSSAQFAAGTVGGNLTTSEPSGQLSYKNTQLSQTGTLNSAAPSSTYEPVGVLATGNNHSGGGIVDEGVTQNLAPGAYAQWRLQALNPIFIQDILVNVHAATAGTFAYTMEVYLCDYANGLGPTGAAKLSHSTTITLGPEGTCSTASGTGLYIPMGESIILRLTRTGGTAAGVVVRIVSPNAVVPLTDTATRSVSLLTWVNDGQAAAGTAFQYNPFIQATIYYYNKPETFTSSSRSVLATLQRWYTLAYSQSHVFAGQAVQVDAEYSNDGATWSGRHRIYDKTFLSENGSNSDPTCTENYFLAQYPDYRVGAAFPGGTQWQYVRIYVTLDPVRSYTPPDVAQSRVSDLQIILPTLASAKMYYSSQASFSTYDKVDYAADIWTGPIVAAGSIATWGAFYAAYTEGQHQIYFQARTATSSGGIAAATWYDIAPNAVPASTNIVASATHFQIRVIFQDNPALAGAGNVYIPSSIQELQVSWAGASQEAKPLLPPVMFYYRGYSFLSFPTKASRIPDFSMAIDDSKGSFNEDAAHRWSTFTAPHYAAYCVVGGKLIGQPVAGGTLARLRNSDVTEFTGLPVTATFQTLPTNAGSMYIKTLQYLYIGMVLNQHANGLFQSECVIWPTTSVPKTFTWRLGPSFSGAPLGLRPGPVLYAFAMGQNNYTDELTFSAGASQLLAFPKSKPYQAEYGYEVGLQERAWTTMIVWQPFLDTNGVAVFPTLTNLGFEFYLENIRGL